MGCTESSSPPSEFRLTEAEERCGTIPTCESFFEEAKSFYYREDSCACNSRFVCEYDDHVFYFADSTIGAYIFGHNSTHTKGVVLAYSCKTHHYELFDQDDIFQKPQQGDEDIRRLKTLIKNHPFSSPDELLDFLDFCFEDVRSTMDNLYLRREELLHCIGNICDTKPLEKYPADAIYWTRAVYGPKGGVYCFDYIRTTPTYVVFIIPTDDFSNFSVERLPIRHDPEHLPYCTLSTPTWSMYGLYGIIASS